MNVARACAGLFLLSAGCAAPLPDATATAWIEVARFGDGGTDAAGLLQFPRQSQCEAGLVRYATSPE